VLKNCTSSKLAHLLDKASNFAQFSVSGGVRFEKRKVDKKANLHETLNMQTVILES